MCAEEVYTKMKYYREMSGNEARRFVYDAQFPYADSLCSTCFRLVYDISKSTFYRIRQDCLSGRDLLGSQNAPLSFPHGNSGGRAPRTSYLQTIAFIESYAQRYGDFMPDANEIHLPDYSWKQVRDKMLSEMPQGHCSNTTFFRAYKSDALSHVKVRKCKRFSKCDWCSQLTAKIRKSSGVTKEFWENEKTEHNDWQMRERLVQAQHIELAQNPLTRDEHMVVMIDGMDHSKSSLPHFVSPPKEVDAAERLNTHITGVYVPGWKERPVTCYTWHDLFPTGSDSVITMVLKTLCDYARDNDGKLPPTLHLHMDNCWRENKNKYVLAMAHLLVHHGCFKTVEICFLPVGHTHNIVDQIFSRFAQAMGKKDFFTVDDIHRICREGYTTTTTCTCDKRSRKCTCAGIPAHFEHLDEMANWKPVLLQRMVKNIKGISHPRYFRVERDVNGVVRHHYRSQLQDPTNSSQRRRNMNAGCSSEAVSLRTIFCCLLSWHINTPLCTPAPWTIFSACLLGV